MSEMPERKVLKEMLVKLKAKVIDSQKNLFLLSAGLSEGMSKELTESYEKIIKMTDDRVRTVSLLIWSIFKTWKHNFNLLNANIGALIGDMDLYIETLEKYSTELDSTLTDIFEKAKEIAEKKRKQQEELRKKEPSYRA